MSASPEGGPRVRRIISRAGARRRSQIRRSQIRRGAGLSASAAALLAVGAGLLATGLLATGLAWADENHWQLLRPGGRAPQALQWAASAWDPGRNQLLVFGGTDQIDEKNDLWQLDLAGERWDLIRPRGTLPYYRREAAMAFDTAGDRALVFGGYYFDRDRARPTYYDDSWLLELGGADGPEWLKLAFGPQKPAPRRGASMVYQAQAEEPGRMILFGGWDHVSRRGFADVWAFDLAPDQQQWTPIGSACSGGPTPRDGHSAIYDPLGERMIVYGGWDRVRSTWRTLDELWSFDLSEREACWTRLTPPNPAPPALAWHSTVFDACAAGPRMLLFGGLTGTGTSSGYRVSDTSDSWSLALDRPDAEAWSKLDPSGARPRPRDAHVAALDPAGRRYVIFSGWENEGELLRDVWALELAPCAAPSPTTGPSATEAPTNEPTPTLEATPEPSQTPTETPSGPPTETPSGPPTATPDAVATAVAATLTAMVPTLRPSETPDLVGTSVAATLTAEAPTAAPSGTPDAAGTAVAATLTALAPRRPTIWLPWLDGGRASP